VNAAQAPGEGPRERPYSIRAVDRVCDILDLLQRARGTTSLAQVAEYTGLPKSSAFRYLLSLEARRYVQREPGSGEYQAGTALLPLRTHRFEMLRQQALPHLEQLRARFDETLNLAILDRGRIQYLEIVESLRSVRLAVRPGALDPIHSTSLGKAIASTLPAEQVRAILAVEGMPQVTPHTISDPEAFLRELARVREQGYAVDDGENEPDGRCVAVPVPVPGLLAGLSLSAPTARLPLERIREIADALHGAAERLAVELGAPPA
jgi:IclR family transcriptional regulator, acetate operon repressor